MEKLKGTRERLRFFRHNGEHTSKESSRKNQLVHQLWMRKDFMVHKIFVSRRGFKENYYSIDFSVHFKMPKARFSQILRRRTVCRQICLSPTSFLVSNSAGRNNGMIGCNSCLKGIVSNRRTLFLRRRERALFSMCTSRE